MDKDLELAIQMSLREQQVVRFDAAEGARLAQAFKLRRAPQHEPELQDLITDKLKSFPDMKQQLLFLCETHRQSPHVSALLPPLVSNVLQHKYKQFENLGAFAGLQANSLNSPGEVLVSLKDTALDFLDGALTSLSPELLDAAMMPVLKPLLGAIAGNIHDTAVVREKLALLKSLLAFSSFRSVLGNCMAMDVRVATKDNVRGVELQGIGTLFAGGPQLDVQAPAPSKDEISQDPSARIKTLQLQLKALHTDLKDILFTLMKDKNLNDVVLAWIACMLEKSKDSRNNNRCTQALLHNLLSVLLQLCEPFLQIQAKAHQNFARFDYLWFLKKHRCDISDELKLGHSTAAEKSSFSSADMASGQHENHHQQHQQQAPDLGFEIDADEAAALAEAIRMSLETGGNRTDSAAPGDQVGASSGASGDTKTLLAEQQAAQPTIPDTFHFVTDVFFLTLRAISISFVPLLDSFHKYDQAFLDWVGKQQQAGVPAADLKDNPQFQQLEARRIGFLAALTSEALLVNLSKIAVLVAAWLQTHFALANPETGTPSGLKAAQAFADSVPEHVVRNVGVVLRHVIHYAPEILGATENVQQVFIFIVGTLRAPVEVVRNPIARQELADVLLELVQTTNHKGGPPEHRRGCEQLLNVVYSLRETQTTLCPALIKLYINVSYVESQIEVFDKNSARYKISMVLQQACQIQVFRKTVHDYAASNPDFAKFVKEALSDATFLLDDALGRLADVKSMQTTMADKATWEAKPEQEKAESTAYFHQVERTATSFLRMAVKSIEFLLFFASDPLLRPHFVESEESRARLIATLLNFLDKLCGERTRELKVSNPEKYGWSPRELLTSVCDLAAQFCQEPGFVSRLVEAAEDKSRFRQAHHILTTKCRPSYLVTQAFEQLAAEALRLENGTGNDASSPRTNGKVGGDASAMDTSLDGSISSGSSSSSTTLGGPGPASDLSPDSFHRWTEEDEKDVDLQPYADAYVKALFPLINTDARLSDAPEASRPAEKKSKEDENSEAVTKGKSRTGGPSSVSISSTSSNSAEESEESEDEDDGPRTYSRHHYSANISQSTGLVRAKMARLLQENRSLAPDHATMRCSLPLHPGASIFLCRDEDRMDVYTVMISGPSGTPYAGGLFEFHVFIPDAYPDVPPLVNLETTGGNQVRFNPNLYSCGKVCLSLLGTWHGGQKTDGWNKDGSTLLQVLVSIQSLIMVEHPYFNEPGYESQLGTDQGMRNSSRYNFERIVANIKLAMIGHLRNPPRGFREVVHNHFLVLGDAIIAQCQRWARRAHAFAQKNPGEYDWSGDIEKQTRILAQELLKLKSGSK